MDSGMCKKLVLIIVTAAVLSVGCTKKAENITATYVSPITYDNFTCSQLAEEMQRVSQRASSAAGLQNSQASKDALLMTAGIVIFLPALLFLSGGDGANAAELARLKGSIEALEQTGIRKNCGIQIKRPEPPRRPRTPAREWHQDSG